MVKAFAVRNALMILTMTASPDYSHSMLAGGLVEMS
jgi:hypothetical protein